MVTKERRKQKDFFEKERLKSKMKMLRVSPFQNSAVSLDLLNLYVVNQISTKKKNTGSIQKPVQVDMNRGVKIPLRRHNVELPNSPEHRPPKPLLDDIQHRVQEEILENRRKYLSEKENFQSQWLHSSQIPNIKSEDTWISKEAYRKRDFNDPDVDVPIGQYFQQLNSPEYRDIFGKSPKVTDVTDFGNSHSEEGLFGIVKDTLKTTQSENFQPIVSLFEEQNQHSLTTSACHPLVNRNIIDQLFTDSGDRNQISNIHSPFGEKEMHQITSPIQSFSAERDLKGIFTAPEQILFPNSQRLHAIDQECSKNQFKNSYIQERNPGIFSDQPQNTTAFENTGRFENQKKETQVADTVQNCLKTSRKCGRAEPNLNRLQIFELEETEKDVYNFYDQHSKQERQKDDELQLNSQSPSYSPKQTDRYVSTSDESEKEEQDGKASCLLEEYSPRNSDSPLSASRNTRSQCNCHLMGMYSAILCNESSDTAEIQPLTEPAMNLRKCMLQKAGTELPDASFENKCANFKAKYNAWSQTETWAKGMEKSDAAVQCDLMQGCRCRNELSSVHSAEIVASVSKIKTTGGQNIPADRAALHSSSSDSVFTKSLSPEREHPSVSGKINQDIIDFIQVINKV